jgi:hypothetical protein
MGIAVIWPLTVELLQIGFADGCALSKDSVRELYPNDFSQGRSLVSTHVRRFGKEYRCMYHYGYGSSNQVAHATQQKLCLSSSITTYGPSVAPSSFII